MDKSSKGQLELKKSMRVQQQNINRLYSICSALYQEIQDIKRFVNYKHDDSLGDVESSSGNINQPQSRLQNTMNQMNQLNQMSGPMNVLDQVEEFADNMPKNRKLRIINN